MSYGDRFVWPDAPGAPLEPVEPDSDERADTTPEGTRWWVDCDDDMEGESR